MNKLLQYLPQGKDANYRHIYGLLSFGLVRVETKRYLQNEKTVLEIQFSVNGDAFMKCCVT